MVLNIIYNFFTGGTSITDLAQDIATGGPTNSPELGFSNAKWVYPTGISILATSAAPLWSRIASGETLDLSPFPQPYGFNTLLLSNTSAASLDAPLPEYVSHIQKGLSTTETINITTTVRATVVTHTPIEEGERTDETYWQQFYRVQSLEMTDTNFVRNEHQHYWVLMLQCGLAGADDPEYWNGSWFFTGGCSVFDLPTQNSTLVTEQHRQAFAKVALRFDAKRHLCNATWTITETSMQLSGGTCSDIPLPQKYQWMQNAETLLGRNYWAVLYDFFRCFDLPDVQHCNSPRRIQIHATMIALAYQAHAADSRGWISIQPSGSIWNAWKNDPGVWRDSPWGGPPQYLERYPINVQLRKTRPTLRDDWALYWTVAIMPTLTFLAFFAIMWLYNVPLSRDFGITTLLAGINRFSLDVLAGAAFSGETDREIYLQIKAVLPHRRDEIDKSVNAIEYYLGGQRGKNGNIERGTMYG